MSSSTEEVVVPVAHDSETFGLQDGFSRRVAAGVSMLTAVDLDDGAFLKANEVEDEILKRHLPAKLVSCEPPIAEQPPHRCFRLSGLAAHALCELADAFSNRPMVWRLRREPLTRRLTS